MSKQGQEAQDRRQDNAAEAQLESEVRELAPTEGTLKAEEVRDQVQSLTENGELPSFKEAFAEIEAVPQGDNAAADRLSHKYGNKRVKYVKRVPNSTNGGPGWHCKGREDGPLPLLESLILAGSINDKIDEAKMNADALNRKSGNQKENKKESIDAELIRGLIAAIEAAKNLEELHKIAHEAADMGLLVGKSTGHNKWKVEPIPGVEGSEEVAQAIESKKKKLIKQGYVEKALEAQKQERLQHRLAGIERKLNEKQTDRELEIFAYRILEQEAKLVKKVNLADGEWTVEALENVELSEDVVALVLARKEILKRAAEAKRNSRQQTARATIGDKYRDIKRK